MHPEVVVSNAGPAKTIELIGPENLDAKYVDLINETVRPTALTWIQFDTDEPLCDYSAVTVSGARRVNMIDTPTIGDYVIVHAGFAIERLDPQEAAERIAWFQQIAASNAEAAP